MFHSLSTIWKSCNLIMIIHPQKLLPVLPASKYASAMKPFLAATSVSKTTCQLFLYRHASLVQDLAHGLTRTKGIVFFFCAAKNVGHSFIQIQKSCVFFFPRYENCGQKKNTWCFFSFPRKSSLAIHSRSGEVLDIQNYKNERYTIK